MLFNSTNLFLVFVAITPEYVKVVLVSKQRLGTPSEIKTIYFWESVLFVKFFSAIAKPASMFV